MTVPGCASLGEGGWGWAAELSDVGGVAALEAMTAANSAELSLALIAEPLPAESCPGPSACIQGSGVSEDILSARQQMMNMLM